MKPNEIASENVKTFMQWRGLSHDDVADRMTALGFPWQRKMVNRLLDPDHTSRLTVDQWFGLALTLQTTVANLFDPRGVEKGGAFHNGVRRTKTGDVEVGTQKIQPGQVEIGAMGSIPSRYLFDLVTDDDVWGIATPKVGVIFDPHKKKKGEELQTTVVLLEQMADRRAAQLADLGITPPADRSYEEAMRVIGELADREEQSI